MLARNSPLALLASAALIAISVARRVAFANSELAAFSSPVRSLTVRSSSCSRAFKALTPIDKPVARKGFMERGVRQKEVQSAPTPLSFKLNSSQNSGRYTVSLQGLTASTALPWVDFARNVSPLMLLVKEPWNCTRGQQAYVSRRHCCLDLRQPGPDYGSGKFKSKLMPPGPLISA